jgi:hypothetical protein
LYGLKPPTRVSSTLSAMLAEGADQDGEAAAVAAERAMLITVQMWDEVGRVDTKASILIGVIGAAFAVTLAALSGSEHLPWPTLALGTTGLVFFASSVVVLVLTVRPKLIAHPTATTFRSLTHYATASPDQLHEEFACSDEEYFQYIAVRLNLYAQLAESKYVKLRIAVDLLAVGLLATCLAGGLNAFQ